VIHEATLTLAIPLGIPRTTDEAMFPSQPGAHAARVPF